MKSRVPAKWRSNSAASRRPAGFTGLRCAYVVVPEELKISDGKGGQVALKPLWSRRNGTKYNGCPYIVQRAAEAVYSEEGKQEIRQTIGIYQKNAAVMHEGLTRMGLEVIGGKNAPYLWSRRRKARTPGASSIRSLRTQPWSARRVSVSAPPVKAMSV